MLNSIKTIKIIKHWFIFFKMNDDKIAINKIPNEHINEK